MTTGVTEISDLVKSVAPVPEWLLVTNRHYLRARDKRWKMKGVYKKKYTKKFSLGKKKK